MQYDHFFAYNAELAGCRNANDWISERLTLEPEQLPWQPKMKPVDEPSMDPLELGLTLLPGLEQKSGLGEGQDEIESYGPEDLEFPTLRFKGLVHFLDEPEEGAHTVRGFCRPIYTGDRRPTRSPAPSSSWLPCIAGVYWQLVLHSEGEASTSYPVYKLGE